MLEVEIVSCPDDDFEGKWCFHRNEIYLGYPKGDITFSGINLSYAFMIESLPDGIQVTPHPDLDFWHLNGKRSTKSKKIKVNDLIEVSGVKLKVTQFSYQEIKTKKQILDVKLKDLVEKEDPILSLIQLLNQKAKKS
jgi:hypothetical protein